jgi:hypothetical protein
MSDNEPVVVPRKMLAYLLESHINLKALTITVEKHFHQPPPPSLKEHLKAEGILKGLED